MRKILSTEIKKPGTVFLSHCLIPLFIFAVMFLSISLFITQNYCGPFYSSEYELDDSIIPDYFVQVSDMHYNHLLPDQVQKHFQLFKGINDNLNPKILIFTGDIVHSINSTTDVSFHHYTQENWDSFNVTYNQSGLPFYPGMITIACAGNHDEFTIAYDDLEHHPFRRYFLKDNETPFIFDNFQMNGENGSLPYNFVIYNPIYPPVPTGPMNTNPFVPQDHIQKLKSYIMKDYLNILICHYPVPFMWSDFDISSKSLKEAVSLYDIMISGHLHPPVPLNYRYAGMFNSAAAQQITQGTNTSVYTIDHNLFSVHNIDVTQPKPLLITYPLPEDSITSRAIFNKHSFNVRVLHLSEEISNNITVTIDNYNYGTMNFVKETRKGVQFYSLPVNNITDGFHSIHVKDMVSESEYIMDFFVGDEYPKQRFSWEMDSWYYDTRFLVGILVFTSLYAASRLIPLWRIPSIKLKLEIFDDYLYSDDQNIAQHQLSKAQIFGYSLLDFITRFRTLPLLTYLTILFDSIMVLFIPLYITPIDDKIGIFFGWGTVIDGHVTLHSFNFQYWNMYNLLFLLPIGSFASFLNLKKVFII